MDKTNDPSSPSFAKAAPNTVAGDILYGADEIAEFLLGSKGYRRSIYNLVQANRVPHFRIGSTICARRSVLMAWIQNQESGSNQT
jgi:hypothetical protein